MLKKTMVCQWKWR